MLGIELGEHSRGRSLPDASIRTQSATLGREDYRQRTEGRARMGRKSEISARQFPLHRLGQARRSLARRKRTLLLAAEAAEGRGPGTVSAGGDARQSRAGAGRFHGHGRGRSPNSTWSSAWTRPSPTSRARWESPCGCCFPRSATFAGWKGGTTARGTRRCACFASGGWANGRKWSSASRTSFELQRLQARCTQRQRNRTSLRARLVTMRLHRLCPSPSRRPSKRATEFCSTFPAPTARRSP